MNKISVVVSAYNEEKNIKDCLDSVKDLADEIIVIDNSSTDKTAVIAREYTKKVFEQKNDPMRIDLQKNFGFSKSSNDWILSLDADERVTPELAKEIRSIINGQLSMVNGYEIPRKNIIFGKWIEHTGWFPDYQLRLFKKGKGKFIHSKVHEQIQINGKVDKLTSFILHENYQTVNQFINRMIVYTDSESQALLRNGYIFNYMDSLKMPFQEFLRRFFTNEGYKDGLHGLSLSLLMSFYHFVIFIKLWENYKFKEKKEIIDLVTIESKNMNKELSYWFYETKVKNSSNPIKKILYKTKQKLPK